MTRISWRMSVPVPAGKASLPVWWLAPAFFVSGFAALIYQVVWQRVLFASFGINIEAVTIVVTAFLAGLGVGSLAGGRVSTRTESLLRTFGIVELSIGLYGAVSVQLFRAVAGYAPASSHWMTALLTIVLITIPTLMMGFTLPLLVAYAVQRNHNVGASVGSLYFVNTAGSSLAALASAAFIMRALGESGSVRLASGFNICVGLGSIVVSMLERRE